MKEKEKMSLVDLGKRLLEASRKGQADEVSMLMASGAPFTTDWLGTSPLHLAAQHGHTQTAEVLLRAGVSRDARTKVDRTPLHMAAQNGHTGIVELLISGGACVNNKDMLNMTPLHWACEHGHVDIIKILLRSGANLDIASKFNKTPLDIARQKGHTEALALLVSDQDPSKVPVSVKRQADRSNLGLNALKKRQRTKKFPMTAGTWTGTDSPGGKGEGGAKSRKKATTPGSLPKSAVANGRRVSAPPQYPNAGSPSLRSPTANSIASLVSAADFVKRESDSEGPESKKPAVTTAASEQDSSILNALATLATANLSQSSAMSTSTAPQQITSVAGRTVGITPLSLPANTSASALTSLSTPLTPSGNFWAPIPSPLTALSVLSSLTSPAQTSPLPNFAMSPFTVPVTIAPQGVSAGQHYLPFVNSGTALTQTTAASVSTGIAAASTATDASAVSIAGVTITSADSAAHATMSQAFAIPSLSVTGMSNQVQAASQFAMLAPHQGSVPSTLVLDAAQFSILNGAGGSRLEQGKTGTVQDQAQDSSETKPDESLPQTVQSSGQEVLVTLQVPAGLQHIIQPQLISGDQPITLQQIQLVPQVVSQDQAGYLAPQVMGQVTQVQSTAPAVQAPHPAQPQFSMQTAVAPQSVNSQDSGTQTQMSPVNSSTTTPPPTSTMASSQEQLATTQASQNSLLSNQSQNSLLIQGQNPVLVQSQGQSQVMLQGQGQVLTGQLPQQPLQQVLVGNQLQQSTAPAQQTVTQSQSFQQGQVTTQRTTSVPQQNQQQISQQLLQQSIPGAGTSLAGATSSASIQSLFQQSFVPQLSQVVIQGGADGNQLTQGSQTQFAPHQVLMQVQEEYRKILEQKQAEEERARKDLQEKLFALQRDSEKYRDELEQAQREAENYKGRLEAESRERVRLHQLYEASKQTVSEELVPATSAQHEGEKTG